ncbi:aegyptin [Drosophila takahashii]|uniref:aegyptin n=1 Tax=Drosophila takahashii TaxID=29030 RepID=UPI003898E0C3
MRILIVVALLAFMAVGFVTARPAEDEESTVQKNAIEDLFNNDVGEDTNAGGEGSADEETQDSADGENQANAAKQESADGQSQNSGNEENQDETNSEDNQESSGDVANSESSGDNNNEEDNNEEDNNEDGDNNESEDNNEEDAPPKKQTRPFRPSFGSNGPLFIYAKPLFLH